jgi:O-acetyl-ADP-ribose deacetylase (regulator of RNase III)
MQMYIIRRRKGVIFEITGGRCGSKCKILGTLECGEGISSLLVLVVGYAPAVTKTEQLNMSLPLWEECAWYVDVPEPEWVHSVEENLNGACDQTDEQLPEYNDGDATAIESGDVFADISVDVVSGECNPGEVSAAESVGGLEGVQAEANDELSPEQECENVDEVADSVEFTVTDQDGSFPGELAEAGTVGEEDHAAGDDVCDEVNVLVDIIEEEYVEIPEPIQYKFPVNKSINKRMYLYLGEIYKLPCDAIVIGQVESLNDRLDGNDVIFTLAGPELEPELAQLAPCTTGDSVITHGWQMPCEWIIHSVGPKYDERYLVASDHALFSAYKSALLLAAEKEVQSLVIGTLYKQSKKYPRFDAAHVALRTVRKFLEHSVGDIFDRVMFCVNTQEDFEIYSALMHAYFPRSQDELDDQLNLLPIELGDEWGEVIIPDRVVKVSTL